jgi:hypothetical protein
MNSNFIFFLKFFILYKTTFVHDVEANLKIKNIIQNRVPFITLVNKGLTLFVALYFLVFPVATVLNQIADPANRDGGIPRSAVYLFKALTPRYEKWARARVASGEAGKLTGANISGTEWPPFGSAFYLWAVESLQEAWDEGDHFMDQAPKDYARGAVQAATRLIIDPNTAAWVRKYWRGYDFLHHEDAFYRMLIISAATNYQKLTGDLGYQPVLRDQVESLSREIDKSPYGLIDDYPQQCFPADVAASVACIRQADPLLGTDHSAFVLRAMRGFIGNLADERGLPPYMADSKRGVIWGPSRGCSNSYLCLFAPEAWPQFGAQLYSAYETHFWQEHWGGAGFREFPKDLPGYEWYWDVDSGPVVAGHGISASAFGLGTARVNGRLDHAYPLSLETLAFSWPLPDGTLLLPRILSDFSDAPYVGEASILYSLTRRPLPGVEVKKGGNVPLIVWVVMALILTRAFFLFRSGIRGILRWISDFGKRTEPYPLSHFILWVLLVLLVLGGISTNHLLICLFAYVLSQFFPLKVKEKKG